MHEHIAPVSNSADTGSVLNYLTMRLAFLSSLACLTHYLVATKLSSHSVPNKLSS